jgi:CBS domain-containing protein
VEHRPIREFIRPDIDAEGPVVSPQDPVDHVARLLASNESVSGRVVEHGKYLGAISLFDLVGALVEPGPEPAEEHDAETNPAVVLRFRKIGESQDMLAQFESLEDARTWLAERPKFVRVLRVEEPVLSTRAEAELHDAMRPLDDEELDKIGEVQRELQRLHSVELRDMQARSEREGARSSAPIEPSSPFLVRYDKGKPLTQARTDDSRPIPKVVQTAVEAWVAQRNEWMHPRERHVGGALLLVDHRADFDGDLAERVEPEGEIETLPGFVYDE